MYQIIKLHLLGEKKKLHETANHIHSASYYKEMLGVSIGRASFDYRVVIGRGQIKLLAFLVLFIR